MNCPTCDEFAVLKTAVESVRPRMAELERAIDRDLVCHLSVVHGVSYQDVPVEMSQRPPARHGGSQE